MKDYYKIVAERTASVTTLRLLMRGEKYDREIGRVSVDCQGTVYQLEYPSTKSYGGPETAEALAELLLAASREAKPLCNAL